MNLESKEIIKKVLKSLKELLSSSNISSFELKKLSNQTMENISLFHDQDSISLSVLVYSLYKIFSKNDTISGTSLCKLVDKSLSVIDDEPQFRTSIRKLFDQIKKYDKNLDVNILHLIKHAQIKKGLKVVEHGVSIGQASEIMGVSKWEIMEYLGTTKIIDRDANTRIDAKTRINFTRGLFK